MVKVMLPFSLLIATIFPTASIIPVNMVAKVDFITMSFTLNFWNWGK
jgi:hypothetical protein